MPSNKPRLHVALYARGGRDTYPGLEGSSYHWALIVGPKTEKEGTRGMRYHAIERLQAPGTAVWSYQSVEIPLTVTNMLLVRITVAKIENVERVREIINAVPVTPEKDGWSCRVWVKEALRMLQEDEEALGTREMDWTSVSETALSYCAQKTQEHRFDGKAEKPVITSFPPTFSLLTGTEVIE